MRFVYTIAGPVLLASITSAEKRVDPAFLESASEEFKTFWTYFAVGEIFDDNGDFLKCKDDYSSPSPQVRRKLMNKYKHRAKDQAKSSLDQMIQQGIHYGLEHANCLKDTIIANMSLDSTKRGAVDWNCDDDECDIPVTLKGIWGYGCWCNFGGDLMKGKGTPVNAHDKVCQDMQLCLRCAEMDAADGSYSCNVKTTQYNSMLQLGAIGLSNNNNSINSGCTGLNGDDKCAAHVCTCEVQMINDLLELVWSGYTHDMTPRHPDNPYGGAFDWDTQCFTDPNGQIIKECCGKYPYRFPYNSLNKECCEKNGVYETFNPLDKVCCDSGVESVAQGGCN